MLRTKLPTILLTLPGPVLLSTTSTECQEQGDKEITLGLPTNSLTARPGNLPHSQKVFIDIFGKPSAAVLARVAPATGSAALANCEANLAFWRELMEQGVTAL